ncbi:MAG: AEC family transporter [Cyanobacteria bacterium P01_A01_bin.84]
MSNLLELYIKLVGLVLFGLILGRKLPAIVPTYISQFIFWVGAPVSIITFVQRVQLSNSVWIAPVIAYIATFAGAILAWLAIQGRAYWRNTTTKLSTRGSLILVAMVGNTGFLGYPITLSVADNNYFAWALFYDLLGTLFAAYGIGIVVGNCFSTRHSNNISQKNSAQNSNVRKNNYFQNYFQRYFPSLQIIKIIIINPALWGFGIGLVLRHYFIPQPIYQGLEIFAWSSLALSLILIGMRLSKLSSWHSLPLASLGLTIKMLLVPLVLGTTLKAFGLEKAAVEIIVLQMAMPPAFATLVIAEIFDLDRDLSVTAIALGSMVLLITLPIWLWLF